MEWVATAFERIGHTVRRIHKDPEALSKALKECDLAIFGHKSLAGRWPNIKEAFRNRNCPVVYWWFDLVATHPSQKLENQPLFKSWAKPNSPMFREADITLVKERDLVSEYRKLGVNAYWFDQGVLSDFPAIEREEPEYDVLFWGQTNAWTQRMRDANSLNFTKLKVAWLTNSSGVPSGIEVLPWTHPDKIHEIAAKSRCVVSCGFRNDVCGYWSDSFWMAAGMGNCVLRRYTPGLPDGPYCIYHNETELCNLVSWVKSNPEQANGMGERARKWATTKHSLEARAKDLIRLVRIAEERGELKVPRVVTS